MHEGVEPRSPLRLKYLLHLHAKIKFYSDVYNIPNSFFAPLNLNILTVFDANSE